MGPSLVRAMPRLELEREACALREQAREEDERADHEPSEEILAQRTKMAKTMSSLSPANGQGRVEPAPAA